MLEEEDEAEPAAREGEKRLDSQGSDPALDTGLPAQTSGRAGCTHPPQVWREDQVGDRILSKLVQVSEGDTSWYLGVP